MPELDARLALAYWLGGCGILAEWHSYRVECGSAFRKWSGLAAVLWAAQYVCLAANTAALTMGLTAFRTWISLNTRQPLVVYGFVAMFVGLTIVSWQGPVSLLPAFATINTSLALFYCSNRSMRILMLLSGTGWIANDIYWSAWTALLAESVAMLINLRTISRLKPPDG